MSLRRATGSSVPSGRPQPGEYASYAQEDIDFVAGDDAVSALRSQGETVVALLASLDEATVAGLTYQPGKWTLKDVIGHLADDERIFAYRALCLARGDTAELPGFDENLYASSAGCEALPLRQLSEDYQAVRLATLTLLSGLTPEAWLRRGTVNAYEASARGLAFHIAGHELHHLRVLDQRYLPLI